jgi:hypothetical protein
MAIGRLSAQAGGGVALRIEIDQQRLRARSRQRSRQIQGGGRLAYAPFLIGHAKYPSHDEPPCRRL